MVFSGRIPGTRLRYWPAGLQLMAWEDTAGRNAAYGEGRSGGPERSLRREKERQTGTQLNDWDFLMGRAVLWLGG